MYVSVADVWLHAKMAPPVAGMFSSPSTVGL